MPQPPDGLLHAANRREGPERDMARIRSVRPRSRELNHLGPLVHRTEATATLRVLQGVEKSKFIQNLRDATVRAFTWTMM